ncbi:hypothetical protein WDW89_21080 [Deltaproteobacteria bacterium TL4]
MKRFFLRVALILKKLVGLGILMAASSALGGTLVMPSQFLLHRPLNPALNSRLETVGLAYGEWGGNRNLFNKSPGNCLLRGYDTCEQSSNYGLLQLGGETHVLVAESLRELRLEEVAYQSYSIELEQFERDVLYAYTFKGDFMKFGFQRHETESRLIEHYQDALVETNRRLDQQHLSYGAGLTLEFGDSFSLAYYHNETIHESNDVQDGQLRRVAPNMDGGGFGFRVDMGGSRERPDELILEAFVLNTFSPEDEDASLSGIDFEISINSFVFYALILNDNNNNYFVGELSQDYSGSYAAGFGWNGETLQILIGRDTRYFVGVDGGLMGIVSLQF